MQPQRHTSSRPWLPAVISWLAWLALCAVAAASTGARAQGASSQDQAALQAAVQQWLASPDAGVQTATNGGAASPQKLQNPHDESPRVEVILGELDPRLKLAPCARIQAYLPRGANLWGRSRVGIRCEEGARWNVLWPVTVKVWAPALVAARTLPAGTVLGPGDVKLARVDLASGSSPAIRQHDGIVGRTLARTLTQGSDLRMGDLKVRRWFSAGEPVRLVVRGAGFQAAASGTALGHGDEGRCARVRMDTGRILCAQPVGDGLAELTL